MPKPGAQADCRYETPFQDRAVGRPTKPWRRWQRSSVGRPDPESASAETAPFVRNGFWIYSPVWFRHGTQTQNSRIISRRKRC